jgi:hypothetical protein
MLLLLASLKIVSEKQRNISKNSDFSSAKEKSILKSNMAQKMLKV